VAAEIRDYLEIPREAAADQWREIQARRPLPKGERQGRFLPIEVVLSYALFRILDPRGYGGRNIDSLPEPALRLAHTLCRPPGSLTNKMLNLSFDRAHGAKLEPEVFLRLGNEPERFLTLYRTIVEVARDLGLGADAVPDFVGVENRLVLLGQEELGPEEIEIAVAPVRRAVETAKLREWFSEQETERFAEQRIRLGQHRFAEAVYRTYEDKCGFCGFSASRLGAGRMLVASHIKPWRVCEPKERLDPANGIAACPIHDRAFDGGLLTVNGGLRIHRARVLQTELGDRMTGKFFGDETLAERLVVPAGAGPGLEYLEYHKNAVFEKVG
jgi:putative restriction endonuclease